MNRTEHIALMANYNQWMNRKLYDAAQTLTDAELAMDRQAFFGSILGTLNHLVLGDTVWLKRFAQHPAGFTALAPLHVIATPADLKQLAFADIRELAAHRTWLDQLIVDWSHSVQEPDLAPFVDDDAAIALMLENPSVIKRPVLDKDGAFSVGFNDAQYQQIFNT